MSENNLNEAGQWLADCYRLDKADPGVLEQLGVLFERRGDINGAIKYWKKTLEVKKDSALAKEKLATYVSQSVDNNIASQNYDEALKQMDTSGKAMANDPKFLLKRGLVYRNLGKWDKAATDLATYTR